MPDGTQTLQLHGSTFETRLHNPQTIEGGIRTVEVIWTTGHRVKRFNWRTESAFWEELVVSDEAVDLKRLKSGAPVLAAHWAQDLDGVIGVVEHPRIEDGKGYAQLRFSDKPKAQEIFRDVEGGIIRNVSVGYITHRLENSGRKIDDLEVFRATSWEPVEISLVPVGADPGARTRQSPETHTCIVEGVHMPQALEDRPVESVERVEPELPQPVVSAAAQAAEIVALVRRCGLSLDVAMDFLSRGLTLDQVRAEALELLAIRASTARPIAIVGGVQSTDNVLLRVADGIRNAMEHRERREVELTETGRQYARLSLLEMGAKLLEAGGVSTATMGKLELMEALLNMSKRVGYHHTTDFAALLANVARKRLIYEYNRALQTWRVFARERNLPDFKDAYSVLMSDSGLELVKVNEHGEYKYGTFTEQEGEKWHLSTYGRIIAFTRQLIINDDLGALLKVPGMFGRNAARTESDLVWNMLLRTAPTPPNPAGSFGEQMRDNLPLFTAAHGNISPNPASINIASLDEARQAIRAQKAFGTTGQADTLGLFPEYLICGPKSETWANVFLHGIWMPNTMNNAIDESMRSLKLIIEQRIEDYRWFLAAGPDQSETIEFGSLEGQLGLFTDSREGFTIDGWEYKARMDFGCKTMNWAWIYMNPGAVPPAPTALMTASALAGQK